MKTVSVWLITFIVGIGLWAFILNMSLAVSEPEVVEAPIPYPVIEYQTITRTEYVDRWHEPQIVTVNNTLIQEVEVEKIVYEKRTDWKFFATLSEFTDWLAGKIVLLMPPADCDDYARRLQVAAYQDGYILSAQLIDPDGYLFGKKVMDKPGYHDMVRVDIGNEIYVVEPKPDKFRIILIGVRD